MPELNLRLLPEDSLETAFAKNVAAYMVSLGYAIFSEPGHLNIAYLEGINDDGSPNRDLADGWNDLRLVFDIDESGAPSMLHRAVATTEPGRAATFSAAAARRGGVARIAFGQYTAWRLGHHNIKKNGYHHPALIQAAPLPVHRDADRNGIRTGDNVHLGIFGINQHSTRPGWTGAQVGNWSEGCLVGLNWEKHLEFISLLKTDPRYQADKKFAFTTAIMPGDAWHEWINRTPTIS